MFHRTLSGLSQEVELTTVVAGKLIDSRKGSLLWTHFGVSGPDVMDATRLWTLAREHGDGVGVYADFLPDNNPEQVRLWYTEETRRPPRGSLMNSLACIVPERFGEALCRHVECDQQRAIAQVPRHERDRLIAALTK